MERLTAENPRQAAHDLSILLARNPDVVAFARALTESAEGRLARIAVVFSFAQQLVAVPPPEEDPRDGVDVLLGLAGIEEGPAVILSALLRALGERASVVYVPQVACPRSAPIAFVRVEIGHDDVGRLPPHATLLECLGRSYLPLDARGRSPLGFLPEQLRASLLSPGAPRLRIAL